MFCRMLWRSNRTEAIMSKSAVRHLSNHHRSESVTVSARAIPYNTHQQSWLDRAAWRGLTQTRSIPALSNHRLSKINQCSGEEDFLPKPPSPRFLALLSLPTTYSYARVHVYMFLAFERISKSDLKTVCSKFLTTHTDYISRIANWTPGFHKRWGISWLNEPLLAFQRVLHGIILYKKLSAFKATYIFQNNLIELIENVSSLT
jgi:hypothetical protein